jgi:hypothetical protein
VAENTKTLLITNNGIETVLIKFNINDFFLLKFKKTSLAAYTVKKKSEKCCNNVNYFHFIAAQHM